MKWEEGVMRIFPFEVIQNENVYTFHWRFFHAPSGHYSTMSNRVHIFHWSF